MSGFLERVHEGKMRRATYSFQSCMQFWIDRSCGTIVMGKFHFLNLMKYMASTSLGFFSHVSRLLVTLKPPRKTPFKEGASNIFGTL